MRRLPFDVIVFDLDGTLADTAPDLTASLNHTLVRLGRPALSAPAVRRMIGNGVRMLVRRGLDATGGAGDALIEEAHALFMDHYRRHLCVETRAYAGADRALRSLRGSSAALAVCTNKPEALAVKLLDRLGWSDMFAAVIGGDTLAVRKPDPAPLLAAIDHAGGGRAVLVGDSPVDAATARAAGIPFAAVAFGYSDMPAEMLGADALIADFAELPRLLLTM